MNQYKNIICGLSLAMCSNMAVAANTLHAVNHGSVDESPQRVVSNQYWSENSLALSKAELTAMPGGGSVLAYDENGNMVCRHATAEEAKQLALHNLSEFLQSISTIDDSNTINRTTEGQNGLRIDLRATQQLENFPEAKAAFIRAAKVWEDLIASPITVILNVDYGPNNLLGNPYSNGTLGGTIGQRIGGDLYPQVRTALINGASTPTERALYETLPLDQVPTDIGNTSTIGAPSAVFRALGILSPSADPTSEANLGALPSVSFNSNVSWDLNPDDGIDADKKDFFGAAVHEIGHALGFYSLVGARELDSDATHAVSVWDLFRFRPQTGGDFTNAQRVLSSGGEHVFYAGGEEIQLSTGRSDHSGGDGQQASHWKDKQFTGAYIGMMNPTLEDGFKVTLSQNDQLALDAMGYTLNQVLAIDDGSFEESVGPSNGGTAYYLNRLTPSSYPATLTHVLAQFINTSGVSAGSNLTILVSTNLGGGADIDSIQFQTTPATVATIDEFNRFDVPDVTIQSGDFIVGFSMTTDQNKFPAALDTNNNQARSYFSVDGTDFELIGVVNADLAGNFGIRAQISP